MSRLELRDKSNQNVLKTFSLDQEDFAWEVALEFEQMGIETILWRPSVSETLASSLGAGEEDLNGLRKSIDSEIESHIDEECEGCVLQFPKKKEENAE